MDMPVVGLFNPDRRRSHDVIKYAGLAEYLPRSFWQEVVSILIREHSVHSMIDQLVGSERVNEENLFFSIAVLSGHMLRCPLEWSLVELNIVDGQDKNWHRALLRLNCTSDVLFPHWRHISSDRISSPCEMAHLLNTHTSCSDGWKWFIHGNMEYLVKSSIMNSFDVVRGEGRQTRQVKVISLLIQQRWMFIHDVVVTLDSSSVARFRLDDEVGIGMLFDTSRVFQTRLDIFFFFFFLGEWYVQVMRCCWSRRSKSIFHRIAVVSCSVDADLGQ